MKLTLNLDTFIADVYWPEMNELIDIGKEVHPKLGEQKKQLAIEAAVKKRGLTMADYERLQEKIKEKFHRNKEGKIYIPASKFLASMAAAADVAPKAVRICDSTALRSVMTATDFVSGRTKADRIDERWVKNRESNQRRLQRDEVLVDVEFVGEIEVAQHIEQDQLERFLDFAFKWSGIGAARKMGYGRGRAKLS